MRWVQRIFQKFATVRQADCYGYIAKRKEEYYNTKVTMLSLRLLLATILLAALASSGFSQEGYQYFEIGHPSNAEPHTTPGFALIGGGTDQDAAFRWMCKLAGRGNFLVLRASGTDAYNRYIKKLCPAASSVATL